MPETTFINNTRHINTHHLDIFCCSFSLDKFTDKLFTQYGIEKPRSIEKSVPKRRAEFLAGRYCAKTLLPDYFKNSAVLIGENGAPIWPGSCVGSISHCEQNAVAALAKGEEHRYVGIDIERIISCSTMESISSQIIDDKEKNIIKSYKDKQTYLFTLFFSIKESFFKAVYPALGFYFNFDAVSVFDVNFDEKTLKFRINYTLSKQFSEGKEFESQFIDIADTVVLTLFTQ